MKMQKNTAIRCPRILFAAPQSASGKTTVTLGVMLALRKSALIVQPFKAGPDYLDPMQHSAGCLRMSRNLDSWLMRPAAILELFTRNAQGADISVIEGAMGLYDGAASSQYGSSAHLSKILRIPVILVINAASLSRSAAAVVLGYKEFDKGVKIAGVILNNVGSANHYGWAKSAIEKKTKVPVLGFLPKDAQIGIPQRHLGLVPAQEKKMSGSFRKKLLNTVVKNIDINGIIKIGRKAKTLSGVRKNIFISGRHAHSATIAIAYDKAFNFYYQDNLDILNGLGARLVFFSLLNGKSLPRAISGIYIGGGYPELFARQLSGNAGMRQAVFEEARRGMPIYAECGGLMYLTEKLIDFQKKSFPMAGIFKCSAAMARRRQALGYIEIEVLKDNILSRRKDKIRAHTFHWSYLESSGGLSFAYKVRKSRDEFDDGLIYKNVLASYAHLHFGSNPNLAKNFIRSCSGYEGIDDSKVKPPTFGRLSL